jgi:hypothetical protein
MSRIQIKESSSYVTSRGRDGAKLMWIFLILVLPPLFASLPSLKYQTLRFDPIADWPLRFDPIGLASESLPVVARIPEKFSLSKGWLVFAFFMAFGSYWFSTESWLI